MEPTLVVSVARVLVSPLRGLVRILREAVRRSRRDDLAIDSRQLPIGGVWGIALRRQIDDDLLQRVPSGNPREQGEWLVHGECGILLGTRGDRFQFYNSGNRLIRIDAMRVRIKNRRKEVFVSEVRSPNAGFLEEDVLGADLSVGADHLVREVRMEAGGLEWGALTFESRPKAVILEPGRTHSVQLYTTTGGDSVDWRLEVSYSHWGSGGKKSRRRTKMVPDSDLSFFTTANQAGVDGVEYWLTGVAGLEERPYLQRAKNDEDGNLIPIDGPW